MFSKNRAPWIIISLLPVALAIGTGAQKQSGGTQNPNDVLSAAASLDVKIVPLGPSQAQLTALDGSLLTHPALMALLHGTDYRRLYMELIDEDAKDKLRSRAPTRFRAVYYDYSNQRTVVAEGSVADPATTAAHVEMGWQPSPSAEEFRDAVGLLMLDPFFGPAINSRSLTTYHPMPPVQDSRANRNRRQDRIIHVGLMPSEDGNGFQDEIVGVDLAIKTVLRYPGGGPQQSSLQGTPCGVAGANQVTTPRGTAGQYQLTVSHAGMIIWEMLVIRPSISSGTRGSAIELRDVKYKGISVLKRAHVPILNIKYVDGLCGPYRDWQYQEGFFQANGTDVLNAPGFRDCGTEPATTSLENGTDTGNFKGVALYREGTEVVLVTELEAGWYRYISEWRFDIDGTIRPRFGFGAIVNSCTCQAHVHHAYFRFDFDVNGPINSIYELPNKSTFSSEPNFLHSAGLIRTEKKILRTGSPVRGYRIRGGQRSYILYPGADDGAADDYARGDMWFLRYKTGVTNLQAEIDDGVDSGTTNTEANLDQFLTNESIAREDSVVWYHAGFSHNPDESVETTRHSNHIALRPRVLTGPEVVGPDLSPEHW